MDNKDEMMIAAKAHYEVRDQMQACIEDCLACASSCTQLIPHFLSLGGQHATKESIGLLSACSLICSTSAKLLMFDSDYHRDLCKICSDICNECADECDELGGADDMSIDTADACRRCADSCDLMASQ